MTMTDKTDATNEAVDVSAADRADSTSGAHPNSGDTKPFAITLNVGSSLANETGSWLTERPIYVDLLPPCNKACPAGENVQQWLYHAEEGNYEAAWREIMVNNPMPAVMGRVCYHPCQDMCNRGQVDETVGINAVERFLGDKALEEGWTVEPVNEDTGKNVLVVGAGLSGLSAAYHLRRFGHNVTIYEAGPMAGGMMRFRHSVLPPCRAASSRAKLSASKTWASTSC